MRRRGTVGVGCDERACAPPQKKIIFVPQNDNFGCIFTQFLTDRKHGHSQLHGFYGSSAKRSLQKQCKNYPKIHSKTRGGGAVAPSPPHEYATVCPHRHRPPLIEYSFSSSRLTIAYDLIYTKFRKNRIRDARSAGIALHLYRYRILIVASI